MTRWEEPTTAEHIVDHARIHETAEKWAASVRRSTEWDMQMRRRVAAQSTVPILFDPLTGPRLPDTDTAPTPIYDDAVREWRGEGRYAGHAAEEAAMPAGPARDHLTGRFVRRHAKPPAEERRHQ